METFTFRTSGLLESSSMVRGLVSAKYINKHYNLGGSVEGSFSLIGKRYFSNKAKTYSNN